MNFARWKRCAVQAEEDLRITLRTGGINEGIAKTTHGLQGWELARTTRPFADLSRMSGKNFETQGMLQKDFQPFDFWHASSLRGAREHPQHQADLKKGLRARFMVMLGASLRLDCKKGSALTARKDV